MSTYISTEWSKTIVNKINPYWFLPLGVATMAISHMTYNVDFVAWFSIVPFLLFLKLTKGWKSRVYFTLTLLITWSLIVAKIISSPIPFGLVFMYSIPISLIHLPGYLIGLKFKHRKFSIFLFPVLMTLLEWIQYTYTPLATWGALSNTQVESLGIAQFVSVFGMAGLSFLIYWVNIALSELLLNKKCTASNSYIPFLFSIALIIWGNLRYDMYTSKGVDTITMAAVGTDSQIGGLPLPTQQKNESDITSIFSRTTRSAELGAKIVVWNEGAFLLKKSNEDIWIDSIKTLASNSNVSIVASYILLTSESPLKYDNKYLLIDSTGKVLHSYLKHEPVPGEPAKKGIEPIQSFNIAGINLGGAICYDYDFPYLAKENRKANADIVALPSSDWRGIDPIHTEMARLRAIEQGHSILRSTRFGLSAAITPYGDFVSKMSAFDNHDKIMITELPKKSIITIHSVIGDSFIYLCILFIVLFFTAKKADNTM